MRDWSTTTIVESDYFGKIGLDDKPAGATGEKAYLLPEPKVPHRRHPRWRSESCTASLLVGYLHGVDLDLPKADVLRLGVDPRPPHSRRERYKKAIALLEEWLADESGYDEETWPEIRGGIERARSSSRRRFSD